MQNGARLGFRLFAGTKKDLAIDVGKSPFCKPALPARSLISLDGPENSASALVFASEADRGPPLEPGPRHSAVPGPIGGDVLPCRNLTAARAFPRYSRA